MKPTCIRLNPYERDFGTIPMIINEREKLVLVQWWLICLILFPRWQTILSCYYTLPWRAIGIMSCEYTYRLSWGVNILTKYYEVWVYLQIKSQVIKSTLLLIILIIALLLILFISMLLMLLLSTLSLILSVSRFLL